MHSLSHVLYCQERNAAVVSPCNGKRGFGQTHFLFLTKKLYHISIGGKLWCARRHRRG